jgi:hypothetical protein
LPNNGKKIQILTLIFCLGIFIFPKQNISVDSEKQDCCKTEKTCCDKEKSEKKSCHNDKKDDKKSCKNVATAILVVLRLFLI